MILISPNYLTTHKDVNGFIIMCISTFKIFQSKYPQANVRCCEPLHKTKSEFNMKKKNLDFINLLNSEILSKLWKYSMKSKMYFSRMIIFRNIFYWFDFSQYSDNIFGYAISSYIYAILQFI